MPQTIAGILSAMHPPAFLQKRPDHHFLVAEFAFSQTHHKHGMPFLWENEALSDDIFPWVRGPVPENGGVERFHLNFLNL